jgi:hypothetical protein
VSKLVGAVVRPLPVRPEHREPAERWAVDAGTASTAVLNVPPHATRERVFDIQCTMTVRLREALQGAWHRMTVTVNGQREWDRQVSTHNPGATDDLDLHLRRQVPVGEALRVVVKTDVRYAQRFGLRIEADENLP